MQYSIEVDGELVLPPKTDKAEVQRWLDIMAEINYPGYRFAEAQMVYWNAPTSEWLPVKEEE